MIAPDVSPLNRPPLGRDGLPFPISRRSQTLQRAFDLVAALAVAVAAVPLIALAWAVVRLTSPGPGFYSQRRVGRNGRVFWIYKIRSMYHDCERFSGIVWSDENDPRVTRVGRILRKFHIDELPQLLNVFRGEMSIVGPRPERPELVETLAKEIPHYKVRLAVRPGVTGLAQIQLPADTDTDSVRTKLVLDHCYVRKAGLWLDTRIVLGTPVYLLASYAAARRLLGLPNPLVSRPEGNPRVQVACGGAK